MKPTTGRTVLIAAAAVAVFCSTTAFGFYEEGGYPTPPTVTAGEVVNFHISTLVEQYDIEIYREGAKRRLVHAARGLTPYSP
jgi:hypothetical protein